MRLIPPTACLCLCLLAGACSGAGSAHNNTSGAQNALGGTGEGPAPKASGGGAQSSGNTSGDNPQGEVSPSGPGSTNASN